MGIWLFLSWKRGTKDGGVWLSLVMIPSTTLKQQVNRILHAKIRRISVAAFMAANPCPPRLGKLAKPYSLPSEVAVMCDMLGRIESASIDELESFAHFAITGSVRELADTGICPVLADRG